MKKKRKKSYPSNSLVTFTDPRSPVAEAYRSLRTNIQFSGLEKPIRSILVTGATPSIGKSTVSANLAVILAQSGASVLVVDADLRRPTLHKMFEVDNRRGLTNLLLDSALSPQSMIQKTMIEGLQVMASGPLPPNPAELLAMEKMKRLMDTLLQLYDYVIYDSPPVMAVTDATVLSRQVDGTILTLGYGKVTREEAVYAKEQLEKARANIIGVIINGMPNGRKGYQYYYYYYASER